MSELELGGVPMRLTLTAAGEEALDPVPGSPGAPPAGAPGRLPPPPPAAGAVAAGAAGAAGAAVPLRGVGRRAGRRRGGHAPARRGQLQLAGRPRSVRLRLLPAPGPRPGRGRPSTGPGGGRRDRRRPGGPGANRPRAARAPRLRGPGQPSPAAVRAAAGDLPPDPDEVAAIAALVGAFAASPLCARLAVADAPAGRRAPRSPSVRSWSAATSTCWPGRPTAAFWSSTTRPTGSRRGPTWPSAWPRLRDPEAHLRACRPADRRGQRRGRRLLPAPAREVVSVRYAAADAARLERELAAVAAPLLAGRFPVPPRPHRGLCATCPGRARLCSWEEEVTLREDRAGGRRRPGKPACTGGAARAA